VSSPQLNTARTGQLKFSFDAPLDMRIGYDAGGDCRRISGAGIAIRTRKGDQRLWRRTVCSCDCKGACCCSGRARYFKGQDSLPRLVGASRPHAGTGSAPGDAQAFRLYGIHVNRELEELSVTLPRGRCKAGTGGTSRRDLLPFTGGSQSSNASCVDAAHPPQPPKGVPVRAVDLPQPGD